jgi:predicted nucleic acid-binding protein
MRLFFDATALVPLIVLRDHWRARFEEVMDERLRRGHDLVTTNWTLFEAMSIARRSGHGLAVNLFNHVSTVGEIVRVDEATEAEALRRFLEWRDKSASVVDHANALIAEAARCDAILSFDDDFVPLAAATGLRILR